MQEVKFELYHHGVKGMKWGVRKARTKFESKVDALTAAKKNHKGRDAIKSAKKEVKSAKAEFKQQAKLARKDFRVDRRAASKKRSIGAKLATNILAGAFANRTYNSIIASGGSKTKARVGTALASLMGPLGHIAVSTIYTRGAGNGDFDNK